MEEPLRHLLDARLIASLGTINRDGTPHIVAMWYLWEAEALLIPTNHATQKIRNLERDPRATVMIHDTRGGFDLCGAMLVGPVAIVRGPRALELNRRIHLRYVTERGLALDGVRRYLSGDDVTIRLQPERVATWDSRETKESGELLESGEFERLSPVHV